MIELVGTGEQKYKIVASSPSDKRLWVTDISKSIARLQGHPPREQPASMYYNNNNINNNNRNNNRFEFFLPAEI